MLEEALELVRYMDSYGYDAYIVGGFVRDYLLHIESSDIDICTNATPKDIREVFQDACMPNDDYGSVTVYYKGIRFEITTFRKELSYIDNRRPSKIIYINNLKEDLSRRDFTINTFCMDKNGTVIDLFEAKRDLEQKRIETVGDAIEKFSEDSLRILRAIRFATKLNFHLSDAVKRAIEETKSLLKKLSYQRKKEELEKIFTSPNVKYGVSLLLELGLDSELEIPKLKTVESFEDILGVWAQLDVCDIYPFSNNEKSLIEAIQQCMEKNNLDYRTLYQYDLYPNLVAATMKKIPKEKVAEAYEEMPIHSKKEIAISSLEIAKLLHRKPGPFIKEIRQDIEQKILTMKLKNEKSAITEYIISKRFDN